VSVLHLHPIARAAGHCCGHRLHIVRATEGIGYVAHCTCGLWGKWKAARRDAVRSFHRHLATTSHRRAA
jgi:hypothetical protein